jgi:hypothetical protein
MVEKQEDLHRKHFAMLEKAKNMKTDFKARYTGAAFLQARNRTWSTRKRKMREQLRESKRDFEK